MAIFTRLLSTLIGKFLLKSKSHAYNKSSSYHKHHCTQQLGGDLLSSKTLVMDVERGLLRSDSTFPYFMLVALEGGSFLRGLLLLLLYPLLCCFGQEVRLRIMVLVSFLGIKEKGFGAGRAVLPKFFLEDVGIEGFEVLRRARRTVCLSGMPRVMVESFVREYLDVEMVVGRELKVFRGYYTGFMEDYCKVDESLSSPSDDLVGIFSSKKSLQHPLFSYCKEVYLLAQADKKKWRRLPRERYPKPLIFHDGRVAFRPTPMATLFMFLWLPVGIPLAVLRIIISGVLPCKLSTPILSFTGLQWKVKGVRPTTSDPCRENSLGQPRGDLYVCNHRTLIDPIYVSFALNKPVMTVSYSLSRLTEIMSPINTVRLTRNREADGRKMEELLSRGKIVVVCPEGTTCREPYLLRFSPLFAELSDDIVPVAVDMRVSMFYATTAGGLKFLDPFFFVLNPYTCYELEFLEKMDMASARKGGMSSSIDMANRVQNEIGMALGFECTALTRRDKYLMLAGNDGVVTCKSCSERGAEPLKS